MMFSPWLDRKYFSKKAQTRDIMGYYFESVQQVATFVSVFMVALIILIIDRGEEHCDSSYKPLVWVVLFFFLLPSLLPHIKIKWLYYVILGLTVAAMIYVPISYFLTAGCPGEYGM